MLANILQASANFFPPYADDGQIYYIICPSSADGWKKFANACEIFASICKLI